VNAAIAAAIRRMIDAEIAARGPLQAHTPGLVTLVRALPGDALVGVEVGVDMGITAAAVLFHEPRVCRYLLVDTYREEAPDSAYRRSGARVAVRSQAQHDAAFAYASWLSAFAEDRREFVRRPSPDCAGMLDDGTADFVFIDADHTYEAVRADLAAWYPKVRPGGLLAGHDYANRDHEDPGRGITRWGVKRAVDEFAHYHGLRLDIFPWTLWACRKPA
jgi:hypothetical protein